MFLCPEEAALVAAVLHSLIYQELTPMSAPCSQRLSWPWLALAALAVLTPSAVADKAADQQPIELEADASQAPRKIFRAKITMAVKPGPLSLYYPKWIPGEHGPTGPITDLTGLKITAG